MAQSKANRGRSGWSGFIVAALSLLALSGPVQAGPMDTGGAFSVSPSGAATYTIPIAVPPGTGGIEPKLALTYNSQAGNGLLGVGWSLSGLSAISRCPRTMAQDGVRGSINFDANDRYCLDGQRLVAISGTYGAAGTEYRTELESFSKIIGYGGTTGDTGYFKVWTKAGQILEYGNTTDSRIEAQGKTQARVWALNKVSDTKGNYFTVTYTEDNPNGDFYPQRIDYTGNANTSLAPNNSVRFVYETRPDIVPLYFAGSLSKNAVRLKAVQAYVGANPIKEYRIAFNTGPSTQRSRLAALSECAMPTNSCKAPFTTTWSELGSNSFTGNSSWDNTFQYGMTPLSMSPYVLLDLDGDGRTDIKYMVEVWYRSLVCGSRSSGSGGKVTSPCGSVDSGPFVYGDIDGDHLTDTVALGGGAVISGDWLSTIAWLPDFRPYNGWSTMDVHPRFVGDVNGDGRSDIVGFKNDGVYALLNVGAGFEAASSKWSTEFGTNAGWTSNGTYPRQLVDMNGDGLPDVVGFGSGGVYVAINTGTGFAPSTLWLAEFGAATGWTAQDAYPRFVADVNGDGLPDVVGFKNDGVYVSINTGRGLLPAARWISDFGTTTATAYGSQGGFPRYLADVNGDGKADIVGFSPNGVQVALSTGTGFASSSQWVAGFGSAAGYSSSSFRQLGDIDGDGFPDVVGSVGNTTSVALSARASPPDLITNVAVGMGSSTALTYRPLTDSSVYVRGNGAAYPQTDLQIPFYVVASVRSPNGLGSNYMTTNYKYGTLRADLSGRGMLGFGWIQSIQADTGIVQRTDFLQDWPYTGLPVLTERTLAGAGCSGILGAVTNAYACLNPQTGSPCSVAAGNRYFPYQAQSIQTSCDAGITLPTATTTNVFDVYGNATQVTVTSSDGFSKTTANTYTNDSTNWLLGRLTRSQVASTAPGGSGGGAQSPNFTFTATLITNTANFNLRAAVIAAGWDQVKPLYAEVIVNPGVYVYSSSTSIAAFSTGLPFPQGSSLVLANYGAIIGEGGTGANSTVDSSWIGYGAKDGLPGGPGGPGLSAQATISVINYGIIAGGGGGGGGSAAAANQEGQGGGEPGGGGAGNGLGGAASPFNPSTGGNGTLTSPGRGCASAPSSWSSGGDSGGVSPNADGGIGTGGGYGQPGQSGCDAFSDDGIGLGQSGYGYGGPGGAAGASVVGNSNVTWTATGTRLGALQ